MYIETAAHIAMATALSFLMSHQSLRTLDVVDVEIDIIISISTKSMVERG